MKLQKINKERYRKHLNIVMGALAATLILSSVGFGQILINLFSDGSGSNFKYNLYGVIIGLMLTSGVLAMVRKHRFMTEVVYVWNLKQALNKIYQKMAKVEAAVANDDTNAMIALNYYYAGSQQLYTLDDNTITMSTLLKDKEKLQSTIESKNLTISPDDYQETLLEAFK